MERQRDAAQTDARRAKEVSLFLTDMLTAADPRAGSEPTSLVSVIDRALQNTEQMLAVDPLVAATVLETIASVNSSLGRFDQALDANQRALDIYGRTPTEELKMVKLLGNRGELLQRAGRYAEAGPLLIQANNRIQELAPGSLDAALIEGQLGSQIMNSGGDAAQARERLASAVTALRGLEVTDERLAAVLNDYGVALAGENRWDEAIAAHEEAVEVTQRALGADHVVTNDMRSGLAGVLGMAGRFRAGAEVHRAVWQSRRKVLGDDNLDTLWSATSLADYLMSSGQPAEAARLSRDSLVGLTKLNGPDHPVTQFAWVTAARAACESGDARWGLEQAQAVYARRVATYGEQPLARRQHGLRAGPVPDFQPAVCRCREDPAVGQQQTGVSARCRIRPDAGCVQEPRRSLRSLESARASGAMARPPDAVTTAKPGKPLTNRHTYFPGCRCGRSDGCRRAPCRLLAGAASPAAVTTAKPAGRGW